MSCLSDEIADWSADLAEDPSGSLESSEITFGGQETAVVELVAWDSKMVPVGAFQTPQVDTVGTVEAVEIVETVGTQAQHTSRSIR